MSSVDRLPPLAYEHDGAVHKHLALLVCCEDAVAIVDADDDVDGVGGVVAAAHLHCLDDERGCADARERLCGGDAGGVANHTLRDCLIVVDVADTIDGAAVRVIDDGGEAGL